MNKFDDMVREIRACRECEGIFGFTPQPVFGGNRNARILQVSQAPSQNVHNTGRCFNDASGRKLREEWYRIPDEDFYDDENFYITGIGHCYPGKNTNGGDRKPPRRCAKKWLEQEIRLVESRIIILIGRMAAAYFFPGRDFAELIFNDQRINGKLTLVMPHPSPLNIKWFRDHPDFEKKRLLQIRKAVHDALYG